MTYELRIEIQIYECTGSDCEYFISTVAPLLERCVS
jgi:hypothetical protein